MSEKEVETIEETETINQETETINQETETETNTPDQITALQAEVEDYKGRWMRNVAEFDNYKKRNAKLWQDAYTEGKADVVLKILPVGDNLDMAISMGLDEKTTEGLKLIKKKFLDVLASLEVEEIDPVGAPFDPNFAEAIMQVEAGEGEDSDTVKQVFQKGYKCKDKVIRYAKVSVIK